MTETMKCVRCGASDVDAGTCRDCHPFALCARCKACGFYLVRRNGRWHLANYDGGSEPCEVVRHRRALAAREARA